MSGVTELQILLISPSEIVFQEQSYSSLHSPSSLAWDHLCGKIANPCEVIADYCRVISNPCGVVVIPETIGGCPVADANRWMTH